MTRKLLPSSYYVPAGNVPYEEKDVIWFTPYGQGLPLVALKNYSIAVPNGTRLAIHEVSNHFTNIKLRTIWPGYDNDLLPVEIIPMSGVSLTELAANVAFNVLHFILHIKAESITCAESSQYSIIEQRMFAGNVFLAGIVNTYGDYWQPILYISTLV